MDKKSRNSYHTKVTRYDNLDKQIGELTKQLNRLNQGHLDVLITPSSVKILSIDSIIGQLVKIPNLSTDVRNLIKDKIIAEIAKLKQEQEEL